MHRGEEIVPAAHVAQCVRENSAKLSGIQVFQELGRKNQDRPQKTNDARFLRAGRDERPYRDREFDGRAGSQRCSNSQPTAASCQHDCQEPEGPHDTDRDRRPIEWGMH